MPNRVKVSSEKDMSKLKERCGAKFENVLKLLGSKDKQKIKDGKVDFYYDFRSLVPPSPEEVIGFLYNQKEKLIVATPKRLYTIKPKDLKSPKLFAGSLAKEIRKRNMHEGVKQYGSFDDMMGGWLGEIERSNSLMLFMREIPDIGRTRPRRTEARPSEPSDKEELKKYEGKTSKKRPLVDLQKTSSKTASEVYYHGDQERGLRIVGEGKRLEHKKELQPGFEKRNLDGIWFNISPEVNEVLYHVYGKDGTEPLFRILKETEVWENFAQLAKKRGLEEINVEPTYKSPGTSSTGGGQGSHILTKQAKEISQGQRREADLFYNTTNQEIIESDEKSLAGKAGEPAEIIIHEISHLVTKIEEFEKDRTATRTASRFGDAYRCYYCGEEFAFYNDFIEHAENEHEGIEAESILKNDSRRRNMMNNAEEYIADMGYLIKNLRYSYTRFWENAYEEGISVLQEKGIENLDMSKASRLMNKDLRRGFEKDVESLNTALSNTEEVIDMLLEEVDDGMTPDRLNEYNQILKKFIDILVGTKEKRGRFQSRAIYTIGFVAMTAYIAITNANLRDVMDMGARTFWKDFRIKWERMENSSEMDLGRFLSKERSHDVFYRVDEIYKVYLTGVETIRKAEKVRKKYQRKMPCPKCNRLCDENWKVCVYCGEKIIR